MKLKAIVIGATGLVGSQLIRLLLEDDRFETVLIFSRRSTGLIHPKLTEHLVDFNQPEKWSPQLTGNVLFSTMGTTLKTAGSKEQQFLVDYTFQYRTAELAAKNNVTDYVLVSSSGANAKSKFFYPRIKGQLEESVQKLSFKKLTILRPSILDGNRNEERLAEQISLKIGRWLSHFIFKKYCPIKDRTVAQAMINSVFVKNDKIIYELDEIFELAGE